MSASRRILALLLAAACVALCASAASAAGQWWSEAWACRRPLTLANYTPTQLAGEDVGVFEMYTGGLTQPGGADVRIVTPDGKELPSRVLMAGPGDRLRVAFGLGGTGGRYFVYFGNPKPPPGKNLDLHRGVLLEMWAYADGGIKTLDQVRKVLASSKEFLGRDFRPRVFQGHNPFGPQSRIACLYSGAFVAPEKGPYVFACSSSDASFVVIDDKEVVDNGGHHKPQGDVSRQGKIDLEPGLHTLSFYHVSTGGDPVAVVAWKTPSGGAIKPMGPEAFAPVFRAALGPMERYAHDIEIDFQPVQAGEAFVADRYTQRFVFDALSVGPTRGAQWQWDFGDGQKSASARVEHVYLAPGEYKVTLTAKTAIGARAHADRVFVSRPWDQVTENKLDGLGPHAKIVAEYDFTALPADALCCAVVLLSRANQPQAVVKAGAALAQKDAAPAQVLEEAMGLLGEALAAGGAPEKAIASLSKGAKMTRDPGVCANLLAQAGQIALASGDVGKAQELFEAVLKQYARLTTSPAIRQAQIGLGDAWRARGDYGKAKEAYSAAKARLEGGTTAAVLKGDLARHVEDHVRQKQWESAREYLQRWEQSLPLDKLEGYWSLMKCRYFVAKGAPAEATAEAELLVKVNPASSYAPELLWLAADAYEKQSKADKAKACLQRLADQYKESPLSVQAAKKLGKP